MKKALLLAAALLSVLAGEPRAWADGYVESSAGSYPEGTQIRGNRYDTAGNMKVIVETRWTNLPTGASTAMFSGDTAIKNSAGVVKDITCYSDAAATAGTIALRDSTAAGTGNILWSFDVLAVAYNTPFTVPLEVAFATGLYADFTTTADVKCMIRYR